MKKAQDKQREIERRFIRDAACVDSVCTAFEANYQADFYFSGEFHPFWEFVYVLSGSVGASGEDRIYRLNEGDIIFHKPMEFHRIWAVDNINPHIFVMTFYMNGTHCTALENGVYSLDETQKAKVYELLHYLQTHTKTSLGDKQETLFLGDWEYGCVSQNVANRLEGLLLSVINNKDMTLKKESLYEEIKVYKKIITILSENVTGWITLEEIARLCSMSVSQIKRVFSKTSPDSIHRYFLKLKIAEAMRLLIAGHTVAETSEALGFSSPNYFCTVFKRETGMTPFYYKQKH